MPWVADGGLAGRRLALGLGGWGHRAPTHILLISGATSHRSQLETAWDHEAYEGPAILLHEAILGKHSVGVEETRQQARKRRFASARVPSDDDIPGSQLWQS